MIPRSAQEGCDLGIGVFVHARPEHTARVLESLRACAPSKIHVFSDGPSRDQDWERVEKVRGIVAAVDWCEVDLVAHERNLGLDGNIRYGVDRILASHPHGVFLEDDCLPTPRMLEYFRAGFERYEARREVMHLNAYSPFHRPVGDSGLDAFASRRCLSWGWGTWRRAWEQARFDRNLVEEVLGSDELRGKVALGGRELLPRLLEKGADNHWDMYWTLSVLLAGGVCITPLKSLVRSIGFDGTGVNCRPTSLPQPLLEDRPAGGGFRLPDDLVVRQHPEGLLLRYCEGRADPTWIQHKIRRIGFHFGQIASRIRTDRA